MLYNTPLPLVVSVPKDWSSLHNHYRLIVFEFFPSSPASQQHHYSIVPITRKNINLKRRREYLHNFRIVWGRETRSEPNQLNWIQWFIVEKFLLLYSLKETGFLIHSIPFEFRFITFPKNYYILAGYCVVRVLEHIVKVVWFSFLPHCTRAIDQDHVRGGCLNDFYMFPQDVGSVPIRFDWISVLE